MNKVEPTIRSAQGLYQSGVFRGLFLRVYSLAILLLPRVQSGTLAGSNMMVWHCSSELPVSGMCLCLSRGCVSCPPYCLSWAVCIRPGVLINWQQGLIDVSPPFLKKQKILKFSKFKVPGAWAFQVACGSSCRLSCLWLRVTTCYSVCFLQILSTNAQEVKKKEDKSILFPFVLLQSLLDLSLSACSAVCTSLQLPLLLIFLFSPQVSLLPFSLAAAPFTSGADFRSAPPGSLLTSV